jgi:site-specific DNA-methyltransferase (adenine-specific)
MERFRGDKGGASRFFYCAKASRSERNAGLEELNALWEKREGREKVERVRQGLAGEKKNTFSANAHPTVKPIKLLRYLCRLVTPPNGKILDPFAGSGSTGCAAVLEGFDFVGIEMEQEYVEIANARIKHWADQ